MIGEKNVLLVVDGDNLYTAAKAIFGIDFRISYLKIVNSVNELFSNRIIKKDFFTTVKVGLSSAQVTFLSRIRSMGFDVHPYIENNNQGENKFDIFNEISNYIIDFRNSDGTYPEYIIVASNNPKFVPIYSALNMRGIKVYIFYFGSRLTNKIDPACKQINMDENYLFYKDIID